MSLLAPVQETVEAPDSHTAAQEEVVENKIEVSEVSRSEQKTAITEQFHKHLFNSCSNDQPVVETSSNGHVDAPKKWYASHDMKEGVSTTVVRAPTDAVKATTPNTAQKPVASRGVQQSHPDAVPATASEFSVPMVAASMEIVPINQKIRAVLYTLDIFLGMQQWS